MPAGSVVKGSGLLVIGRISGMVGSFVLFLLLTWRSKEVAGDFRTAITYFVLMDSLPLLGMHRWLATETARHMEQGWALFRMASALACAVAVIAAVVFLTISLGGSYGPQISACLEAVTLATVPSALNLCILSSLVGIGRSDQAGALGGAEAAVRSILAVILVLGGADIVAVVLVFAVTRWIVAGWGFVLVRRQLGTARPRLDPSLSRDFLAQIPILGLAMVGFLAIRSAAMLLLPLLSSSAETGLYAAPFQLFDLLLIVPTVLIVSSNYAFVTSAQRSTSALRRSTTELLSITALYVFPLAAIACVLARPMIVFMFGSTYATAAAPFQLVLLGAVVLSLDGVLALSMVTVGGYRSDRNCILAGGFVAVVMTCLLSGPGGALGAAAACLAGAATTLALRLSLLRDLLRYQSLWGAFAHPAAAACVAAASVWTAHAAQGFRPGPFALLLAPIGVGVYLGVLYLSGGLTRRRRDRVRHFMTRPG